MTRFGCQNILISDQGTHFVNHTIEKLSDGFQIHHQNTTPYHPQAYDDIEVFNNILENALKNIFNDQRHDWDHKKPAVLWDYHMTCKNLIRQAPFRLVHGQEAIMPLEYIVPNIRIFAITDMTDVDSIE